MTSRVAGEPVVDTHLHLWDLGRDGDVYPWLTQQLGRLHRDHLPAEARVMLDELGVAAAVLVQAEDSSAETDQLLAWAEAHDWIAGVVGWLPLESPDQVRDRLAAVRGESRGRWLVGVRHLVHDDPRADFLDLAPVRESLALVAEAGLPLDVPDAWPRHLGQATRVADEVSGLTVVIDHLAKPPFGREPDLAAWREELAAAAERGNVVAKVSGLSGLGDVSGSAGSDGSGGLEVLDWALDLFGSERLMFGTDWPITLNSPDLLGWVATLSENQRADLCWRTAARVYGLTLASTHSEVMS